MSIDYLLTKINEYKSRECILWNDRVYTYSDLSQAIVKANQFIQSEKVSSGEVVEIYGDFSLQSIALLVALIRKNCIIVPTTSSVSHNREKFHEIAQVQRSFIISDSDKIETVSYNRAGDHELFNELRKNSSSGLILFSSGSTGEPKAAVHDFSKILEKFKVPRSAKRIVNFLLFDHIGGLNTLLHTLSNGGCVITLNNREPAYVCRMIEKYKAEVLPTSPTFLNLLLLSRAYDNYNLESLELMTYGTEPMPESTLSRLNQVFPGVKFSQTYGLSEIGILRAKSKSSESLMVKIGGEGFETRIVDGMLEVKARSAMLGYLNAPSPFTDDGWFKTGDMVEQEGEYLKILGRKSEIINVGGEKVYPAEVESVIQTMPNIRDVVVRSEKNPILGQVVVAEVLLNHPDDLGVTLTKIRNYCGEKLSKHAVPQKVLISNEHFHTSRFKRVRNRKVEATNNG